jgi:hypothetical protein
MGAREQPAEVGPAAGIAHEQREMAWVGAGGIAGRRWVGGNEVGHRDLGAVDRAQPQLVGGLRELHRAETES